MNQDVAERLDYIDALEMTLDEFVGHDGMVVELSDSSVSGRVVVARVQNRFALQECRNTLVGHERHGQYGLFLVCGGLLNRTICRERPQFSDQHCRTFGATRVGNNNGNFCCYCKSGDGCPEVAASDDFKCAHKLAPSLVR